METSRDKTPETEGTTSIRLRYSRQFQNGGHAHTIDAEATLAVGAGPEKREQIIRELEAGVEQLARQITQRGSRSASEAYPQASARPSAAPAKSAELPAPQSTPPRPAAAQPPTPLPAASAAPPTAPLPVSESMPAAPTTSGERMITLPYFIDYIKKRWDMSRQEAMELLDVRELTGLNLRDALFTLRAIKEPNAGTKQARTTQQQPVVEAPRQPSRGTPSAPNSRPPASQAAPNTAPITRAPGASAPRTETPAAPQSPSALALAQESKQSAPARDQRPDFAGSPKAPIPIHLAEVHDITPRYAFEEEDEEEYELPLDEEENGHRQAAQNKLDELKNLRGGNTASPERLSVLGNVLDGQISEEQLEKLIKIAWNATSKKRLKVQQVEALISWAKEADYFVDEVESLLTLIDEEEE